MIANWLCPCCSSDIPQTFDICWNCGADRDGQIDPDLVPVPAQPESRDTDLAATWPSKALVAAGSAFCAMIFCGTQLFILAPDPDSRQPLSDGAKLCLWLTAAASCAALGAFAAFTVHFVDPQPRERDEQ